MRRLNFASCWAVLAVIGLSLPHAAHGQPGFQVEPLPPAPSSVSPVRVSAQGEAAILFANGTAYVFEATSDAWLAAENIQIARPLLATAGDGRGVVCVLSSERGAVTSPVVMLQHHASTGTLELSNLPDLPAAIDAASATVVDGQVHLTDGKRLWVLDLNDTASGWQPFEAEIPSPVAQPALIHRQRVLYVFGADAAEPDVGIAYRFDISERKWQSIAGPPSWPGSPSAVPYGLSHIFFFASADNTTDSDAVLVSAYHTITDRYIEYGELDAVMAGQVSAADLDGKVIVITAGGTVLFEPAQVETNYGWLDNTVVAVYLLGMIGVGWYFTRRENSSNDYFRGGQRIPWWAAGMSLFATGASAISLAGMPGMGFGTDWTYFTLTIMHAICLPIAIFVMAPLVRRLRISTANEYLERRFGLTSRLFASTIWIFTQVAARIASVMLLSAIALEAITDMDIVTAILIMGLVTTTYTYLGGLEAVIWTDTIQGFVMVLTVLCCLILALVNLDATPAELWTELQAYEKLQMFDWDFTTWARATTLIFFLHIFFLSFIGISDQNFVQRVQSTPDLKQTKLAVAAQMAVAVPINILLFSLGTSLWLFYRSQPEALSPTMINNDAVFPFFAAQQLPTGVSGIVVAALLAATMSTVSSGICSVSDLCTNDFYRRFKRNPTDQQVLLLGRILTATVGVFGTLAAVLLAQLEGVKSVWDTATMVTGLISSSVIGLFMLGLISKRTHEFGALVGTAAGMLTVVYLKIYTDVIFWLYIVVGTSVTVIIGVLASLMLPGHPRAIEGLTFFSLPTDDVLTNASVPPIDTDNETAETGNAHTKNAETA